MTERTRTRYWVDTTSLERVLLGVAGSFVEAGPGRDTRLRRLTRGDGIACYSPRTVAGAGRPLQQLTALGVVDDDEPYCVGPWRRRVAFERVRAVPIRPLLPLLGFITDEQRWGMSFRRGLFEVPAGDFGVLAGAMRDALHVDDAYSATGRVAGT